MDMKTNGKPRHPVRTEMSDIWALERKLDALKIKANREMARLHEKWAAVMRPVEETLADKLLALKEACHVPVQLGIETESMKWGAQVTGHDGKVAFVAKDFGKE